MKKASVKRLHTTWFHLYNVHKGHNYRDEISGYQEMEGVDVTRKGHTHETALGGDETPLCLDFTGGYTNFFFYYSDFIFLNFFLLFTNF